MLLTVLIQVAGGLALFLLGINFLSKGMERFAGAKIQKLIESITNNRLKGFGVGMLSSAAIQSSSIVMVSMIGMMNAGLMGLNQGIGIILGFEIGTTLTAQLVAFDVGIFFLLAIALGFSLSSFSRKLRMRYLGQAILGLGVLFMGMSLMKDAMAPLSGQQAMLSALAVLARWPIIAVVAGLVLTALIQASAATVGMAIAMGAAGVITLPAAIALGFGANIGTCVTGLLASVGGSRKARQAVAAQFLIAILGVLLFLPILHPFASVMELTAASLPRQIANAHTIHNALMSLLLLPFVGLIARLVRRILPDSEDEHAVSLEPIEPGKDPAVAVEGLRQQVLQLGRLSQGMLNRAGPALLNTRKRGLAKTFQKVKSTEALVDKFTSKIEEGLNKIPEGTVTKALAEQRVALRHNIMDIERVADLSVNLMEFAAEAAETENCFDSKENAVLLRMFTHVSRAYATALEALEKQSPAIAREARFIEERVDAIDAAEHKAHLRRLDKGVSRGRGSVIFENAMHDLERISDHADNIALSMLTLRESGLLLPD